MLMTASDWADEKLYLSLYVDVADDGVDAGEAPRCTPHASVGPAANSVACRCGFGGCLGVEADAGGMSVASLAHVFKINIV